MVGRWRKRFFEERLAGLDDRERAGGPRRFPPEQIAEVKAIACDLGVPLSRFSRAELHRLVVERGVCDVSASTIARWLCSRGQRVEHTYQRGGALTHLAALDIGRRGGRRPRVCGRSESRGGIEPFDRLVWQVMSKEPHAPRAVSSGSSTPAPPSAA